MKKIIVFLICVFLFCSISLPMAYGDEPTTETTTEDYDGIIVVNGGRDDDETTTTEPSSEPTTQSGENSNENHQHDFIVIDFNGLTSVVDVKCNDCNEVQHINFAEHLSTEEGDSDYLSYLDINEDEYINAKDYVLLLQEYTDILPAGSISEFFNDTDFSYKEKFFYIFSSTLLIIKTVIISISVRRKA